MISRRMRSGFAFLSFSRQSSPLTAVMTEKPAFFRTLDSVSRMSVSSSTTMMVFAMSSITSLDSPRPSQRRHLDMVGAHLQLLHEGPLEILVQHGEHDAYPELLEGGEEVVEEHHRLLVVLVDEERRHGIEDDVLYLVLLHEGENPFRHRLEVVEAVEEDAPLALLRLEDPGGDGIHEVERIRVDLRLEGAELLQHRAVGLVERRVAYPLVLSRRALREVHDLRVVPASSDHHEFHSRHPCSCFVIT